MTAITTNHGAFTVKTEQMGDYEFNAGSSSKAQQWKAEIEKRVEQAKLTRSGVQDSEKYKESFAYFRDIHKGIP